MTTYTHTVAPLGVLHLAVDHPHRHIGQPRRATTLKESQDSIAAMHRAEVAMTPLVRPARRSMADASLVAKPNQVRTMVQHDWSMPEAPDQFHQLTEANEYHWKTRNVHHAKRRDVETARPSGVARRSSRAEPHSRDQLAPSTDMKPASYALRVRSAVPSHKPKRSLTREVDGVPSRSGRKRVSGPPADQELRALGAWSESSLVRHKGIPAEFLGDDEQYMTAPSPPLRSPGYARLPTPDLVPISGDHEFCSCCVVTAGRLDQAWYKAGRAKMDAQLESAMAHIATMSSTGRQVERQR